MRKQELIAFSISTIAPFLKALMDNGIKGAQVEGVIGTLKSKKYGFNKPNAKSIRAMETYGHRSFLGFNLSKMVRKINLLQMQPA